MREVFAPVLSRLEDVESFLSREMNNALPLVGEVAGYVLGSGGKRLRPALMLLIGRMLGYTGERDVRYAAVVELIHTATLIHDDIIDQSDLRRGKPTANRKWGNQTTVLVGDWLYSRTMDICLEFGDVDVMRRLVAATLQMIEGEILADKVRCDIDIDESVYMDITRRKTAELFAAACSVPALYQPATLHYSDDLLAFGRDLGLCFQLIDDVLDYTSSRREMGKPVMADLREGRVTLPMLRLLPRLSREKQELLRGVAETGEFVEISADEVLEMVRTSGVLAEVRELAVEYSRKAQNSIAKLPACEERESLALACELLVDRRA